MDESPFDFAWTMEHFVPGRNEAEAHGGSCLEGWTPLAALTPPGEPLVGLLLANAIVWFVVAMGWGAALLTPRNVREVARLVPLHFLSTV